MKVNSISGVTYDVKDLGTTADFYEALGFRLGKREEDRLTCYVNWFSVTFIAKKNEIDPEPQGHADLPNKGAGITLQIKVNDVDAFYRELLAAGMQAERGYDDCLRLDRPVQLWDGRQRGFHARDA
jgi:catechol 2,3-dioxygenase-like lactoylglutathione lyase family enzyme